MSSHKRKTWPEIGANGPKTVSISRYHTWKSGRLIHLYRVNQSSLKISFRHTIHGVSSALVNITLYAIGWNIVLFWECNFLILVTHLCECCPHSWADTYKSKPSSYGFKLRMRQLKFTYVEKKPTKETYLGYLIHDMYTRTHTYIGIPTHMPTAKRPPHPYTQYFHSLYQNMLEIWWAPRPYTPTLSLHLSLETCVKSDEVRCVYLWDEPRINSGGKGGRGGHRGKENEKERQSEEVSYIRLSFFLSLFVLHVYIDT